VLVSNGIAEVGHNAVALNLLHVAVETLDRGDGGFVVARHDAPVFFGVKAIGQRGGTHQIAEQHRHLTALAFGGQTLPFPRSCGGAWRLRRG
jgi:hypothetical protein